MCILLLYYVNWLYEDATNIMQIKQSGILNREQLFAKL